MNIIEVVFDIPVDKKFEYLIDTEISPFVRVLVPFGKTKKVGFVVSVKKGEKQELKKAIKVYDKSPIINSYLYQLANFISETFISSLGQAIFSIIGTLPIRHTSFDIKEKKVREEKGIREIIIFKKEKEKMDYYLNLVKENIKNGSVLFLLPEVEIAKEYFSFFNNEFKNCILYYGEMRRKEKGEKWLKIAKGENTLIIGTRICIFLPISDPSSIIIEDATNQAYLERQTPKYETLKIAEFENEKIGTSLYLGENCLSVENYLNIKSGKYMPVVIGEQENASQIYILKLRKGLMDKNLTFLTKEAVSLMEETIIKKKKVAIVHNRKGGSKILICEKCNYKFTCKHCSTLLTLSDDGKTLFCKYCKTYFEFEKKCPECNSKKITFKSYGIEKMANVLKQTYKNLKIEKYTGEKKTIDDEFDILIGTGIIEKVIKKFDFGLIIFSNADLYLNLNDFLAEEKFFILVHKFLSMVENSCFLIIQTGSPELEIFKAIKERNEDIFFEKEIKIRKQIGYPPFSKLLKIEIKGSKKTPLEKRKKMVEEIIKEDNLKIIYSGESFPPIIGKKHIWEFLIKIDDKIPQKIKELIDGKFITASFNPSHI